MQETGFAYICKHTALSDIKSLTTGDIILCFNQESTNYCHNCIFHCKKSIECKDACFIKVATLYDLPIYNKEKDVHLNNEF